MHCIAHSFYPGCWVYIFDNGSSNLYTECYNVQLSNTNIGHYCRQNDRLIVVLSLIVGMQEILVDRAVHAAVSRFLPSKHAYRKHETPVLVKEDFSQAMHDFVPVAMRGLTKPASEGGRSGWDDVGGLVDIRNAIQEVSTVSFSL